MAPFSWLSNTEPVVIYVVAALTAFAGYLTLSGAAALAGRLSGHSALDRASAASEPQEPANRRPQDSPLDLGNPVPLPDGATDPEEAKQTPAPSIITIDEVTVALQAPETKSEDAITLEYWDNVEYLLSEDGEAGTLIRLPAFATIKHLSEGRDLCLVGVSYWSPTKPGGLFALKSRLEESPEFRAACEDYHSWSSRGLRVGTSGFFTSWTMMLRHLLGAIDVKPILEHSEYLRYLESAQEGVWTPHRSGDRMGIEIEVISNSRKVLYLLMRGHIDLAVLPSPFQCAVQVRKNCEQIISDSVLYHTIPGLGLGNSNPFTAFHTPASLVPANFIVTRRSEVSQTDNRLHIIDEIRKESLRIQKLHLSRVTDYDLKVPIVPYIGPDLREQLALNLSRLSSFAFDLGLITTSLTAQQILPNIYDKTHLGIEAEGVASLDNLRYLGDVSSTSALQQAS